MVVGIEVAKTAAHRARVWNPDPGSRFPDPGS
jgi:hypothetical protein